MSIKKGEVRNPLGIGGVKKGEVRNPLGGGSQRHKLEQDVVSTLRAEFARSGRQAVRDLAANDPHRFVEVCVRMLPKQAQVELALDFSAVLRDAAKHLVASPPAPAPSLEHKETERIIDVVPDHESMAYSAK